MMTKYFASLIVVLTTTAALGTPATLAAGTYTFTGVMQTTQATYTCSNSNWQYATGTTAKVTTTFDFVVTQKSDGSSWDSNGPVVDYTYDGCPGYASHAFKTQVYDSWFVIPATNHFPAYCTGSDKKIQTFMYINNTSLPYSCTAGQTTQIQLQLFLYGYRLDANNQEVWDPQAVQYKKTLSPLAP